jgi:hypothetical protein
MNRTGEVWQERELSCENTYLIVGRPSYSGDVLWYCVVIDSSVSSCIGLMMDIAILNGTRKKGLA